MKYLISFILFNMSCLAASPLFHAVIGEKWLELLENYNESEKQAFLAGTLFPDIRYLAKFDRYLTHESGLSIEEIKITESPFIKGMRVHCFVDDIRVQYLADHKTLDYFGEVNYDLVLYMKFLEDDILFSKGNHIDKTFLFSYLQHIEPEELNFPVSEEIVRRWHSQNSWYLTNGPEQTFSLLLASEKTFGGMNKKHLQECLNFILQYRKNEFIINYVNDIVLEFEKLFKEYKETLNATAN